MIASRKRQDVRAAHIRAYPGPFLLCAEHPIPRRAQGSFRTGRPGYAPASGGPAAVALSRWTCRPPAPAPGPQHPISKPESGFFEIRSFTGDRRKAAASPFGKGRTALALFALWRYTWQQKRTLAHLPAAPRRPSPAADNRVQRTRRPMRRPAGPSPQRRRGSAHPHLPSGRPWEVGKNMTVYECCGDMIIVDCGLVFPDSEMYGVDRSSPTSPLCCRTRTRSRGC